MNLLLSMMGGSDSDLPLFKKWEECNVRFGVAKYDFSQ